MRVQFAVDCISLGEGIVLATKIAPYIEIIELGEEFISRYGHMAIREFKDLFPDKKILADIKIMDSGYKVGLPCLEAGADIITVCAKAKEKTVAEAIRAARETGKECFVDLVAVDDFAPYVDMINRLKPDYVCAHLSGDDSRDGQAKTTERLEEMINEIKKHQFDAKLVLSGAIKEENIAAVKAANPYHVIIGRAIKEAEDPVAVAKAFYEA
ncbi:MAG: orotidine 5'-phosphate decarboxylase / HUMPS family protein [Christensenellaceae bacterium]|jgi:3-hexulose-6-phosphate synthase